MGAPQVGQLEVPTPRAKGFRERSAFVVSGGLCCVGSMSARMTRPFFLLLWMSALLFSDN